MNVKWNHLQRGARSPFGKTHRNVSPDPFYGQVDEFYDQAHVLSHLKGTLGDHCVPDRCEIVNVRYYFKRSFQVVYKLYGKEDPTILTVFFLPQGESAKHYREKLAAVTNRVRVIHFPSWNAVGWVFPEDPTLRALQKMTDEGRLRSGLGRCIRRFLKPGPIRWDVMNYHPERRCALRYLLSEGDYTFVGKVASSESTVTAHRNLMRLWGWSSRRFRIPEPLGLEDEQGIRWESFITGNTIGDLFSEISLSPLMKMAAFDLSNLHQIGMEDLPLNDSNQILLRLEKKIMPVVLQRLSPLGPSLENVYRLLVQKAGLLPDSRVMTIHGDFHAANILFDSDGLTFIDMDSLSLGDPAYDLALFGSRLLLLALLEGARMNEVAEAVAGFPGTYEELSGTAIPDRTYAWYLAALLVGRQLKTCIRHCAPALEDLAPALLHCARETLERGRFDAAIIRN
ncbi:aminoglycoside phosphotransferase family protein [Candidatus Manganitrophus noduliformans]|uniref:Aminoglycoside phosphotransferase family protein n=1 Tax=Candidatus Manganitrophus noduliformans TaxID=2606439 RepID=A0A7X6DUU0_9BACT|nr:phosphotransferase [Candidatus Manganitrophus noduliformans]NKE73769.1 aminoglycoside phosphotransferase family protein [Candidatus Manganitrophus noduliformans]